jgi:EF hand
MVRLLAVIVPVLAVMASGFVVRAQVPPPGPGDAQVKELLLLMDRDKNGKISRQEFMKFMSAEFDRLDINKDGELDVKELTGLRVVPTKRPGGTGSR